VTHRLADRQLERIGAATWTTVRWSLRTRIVQNRLFGRLNETQAVGLVAVLAVGVWLASTGDSSPGQATAAALLYLRIVAPLEGLLFILDDAQAAFAALGRLIGVIEVAPTARSAPRPALSAPTEPAASAESTAPSTPATPSALAVSAHRDAATVVQLRGACFSYVPGHPVLRDIDLRLDPGEVVAVVGATGSGKSTLAHLITGVHSPRAGTIDRGLSPDRIAAVAQEPHVFAGTLLENLTLPVLPEPDPAESGMTERDRAVRALDRAGALPWVEALPDGVDTAVGDGGHRLTPAQAQHLALARVLLLDPPLVVLDEATADAGSAESEVLDEATATVVADRTGLIIAHRLTQVLCADRVVVLDRGAIVEQGTHADLVAADGPYARLWAAGDDGGRGDGSPQTSESSRVRRSTASVAAGPPGSDPASR
jgi:ATP-binding cassette subfamily C protein